MRVVLFINIMGTPVTSLIVSLDLQRLQTQFEPLIGSLSL